MIRLIADIPPDFYEDVISPKFKMVVEDPVLFSAYFVQAALIALALTLAIELTVFSLFKRFRTRKWLVTATVVNLISFSALHITVRYFKINGYFDHISRRTPGEPSFDLFTTIILGEVAVFLFETVVLKLVTKESWRRTAMVVLLANVLSFLVGALLIG